MKRGIYFWIFIGTFFIKGNEVYAQKNVKLYIPQCNYLTLSQGKIDTLPPNKYDKLKALSGACLLDKNGEIIYHTDGRTVWGKNEKPLQNGLKLGAFCGAYQHSIMLKQPNKDSTYIFTTDCFTYVDPYYFAPEQGHDTTTKSALYSIINNKANNGEGKVVAKNKFLFKYPISKIAATRHSNGRDWWVVMFNGYDKLISDTAYAFLLSPSGISGPVKSILTKTRFRGNGYAKFSPSGQYLALSANFGFELYQFNTTLGSLKLKNSVMFFDTLGQEPEALYVVWSGPLEFDPYEKFLFTDSTYSHRSINSSLVSYDLSKAGDSLAFVNSEKIILKPRKNKINIFQYFLRIDSFIYILGSSNSNGKNGQWNYYSLKFTSSKQIIIDTGVFNFRYFVSDFWMVGPNIANQPFFQPKTTLNIDSSVCSNRTLTANYDLVSEYALKKWSNGDTGSTTIVYTPGWYWHYTIMDHDTLTLDSVFVPPFNGNKSVLPPDTALCVYSDSLKVKALANPAGWQIKWSDNTITNSNTIKNQGIHSFIANKNGCFIIDSFSLVINNPPVIQWPKDTAICSGGFLHISATGYDSALWNDSGIAIERWLKPPGTYSVRLVQKHCSTSQAIKIQELPLPLKIKSNTFVTCFERSPILALNINSPYQIKWLNDGDTSKNKIINKEGIFPVWLTDTNNCKSDDTVIVSNKCEVLVFIPNVFRPLGLNNTFSPTVTNADFSMQIFNGWGQLLFSGRKNEAWDGTYQNELVHQGNYFYFIKIHSSAPTESDKKCGTMLLLK